MTATPSPTPRRIDDELELLAELLPRQQGLDIEARRVLRPLGRLYVSEPVYAGPLNDFERRMIDLSFAERRREA